VWPLASPSAGEHHEKVQVFSCDVDCFIPDDSVFDRENPEGLITGQRGKDAALSHKRSEIRIPLPTISKGKLKHLAITNSCAGQRVAKHVFSFIEAIPPVP
jgi:hypothetical protein